MAIKEFNLNEEILVEITEYGWNYLKINFPKSFEHLKSKIEKIEDKEYVRMQAHNIILYFSHAFWALNPCPIKMSILVP